MVFATGLIIFVVLADTVAEDVTVSTALGNITGTVEEVTFHGTPLNVTKFLGIPFAEPPTRTGRFNKPVGKRSLNGHFVANTPAPVCIQNSALLQSMGVDPRTLNQDEDCLYLNIFLPGNGPADKTEKNAVMVWIYGGGFQVGYQNVYEAKTFAGLNNVILVTFNYRVSFHGFLSSSEDNGSGNYGLWDQHEAIKWVNNHIENFGGDKTRVTIFGESAGAASVVYQALYPGNKGLFQRAIAQSGSANAPWAYDTNPSALYTNYANKTDCLSENQMETIYCLRNLTVTKIMETVEFSDMFLPVKDGSFVKIHPVDIFRNISNEAWDSLRRFGKLDFVIGVNSAEGAMNLGLIDLFNETSKDGEGKPAGYSRTLFQNKIVPFALDQGKLKDTPATRAACVHQYADWTDPENENIILENTVDMLSDIFFNARVTKCAMAHSNSGEDGRLYFYVFDYKSQLSDGRYSGASHAEEIPFVFGFPPVYKFVYALYNLTISQHEYDLSKRIMQYWTNFAKTGDPNAGDTVSNLTAWPEYTTETLEYIRFNGNIDAFPIESRFAAARMNFWYNLIPVINQDCDSACPDCTTSGCMVVSLTSVLFFTIVLPVIYNCL